VFCEAIASGEVNLGGLVDFAEEEGFSAVEVRDDDAALPIAQVEDFVKDAGAKGIEVSYAIRNDMLQEADLELFEMGVERAAICGEGAILRFLASPSALAPQAKKGYTREEVERIAAMASEYARLAGEKGVSPALENAYEPLYGDGETYFGLDDIFKALEEAGSVPANLGITFDPANAVFTSLCKAPTTPEKVLAFLAERHPYIALVHYKTTRAGRATPVITDADIDSERLFGELAKFYNGIVCLEIPPAGDLAACRRNIEASLEYLRKMGLIGYFTQKSGA